MPDSKVYLGHVPFDSSYRHVIRFGSREEQASQMLAHMVARFSGDDYTFIRDGATIRVQANADSLNGYNYLMYNNGNKWYYNFIDRIVYMNDKTSEIYLTRDVMQTWMFDYTRKACFVEREHVANDAKYAHTVPEPNMPIEFTYDKYEETLYSPDLIVVQTTEYPHWISNQILPVSADAVTGGVYHKQYSAAKFLVFDMDDENGRTALQRFFKAINAAGAAEAVVGVFAVDERWLNKASRKELSYEGQGYIPAGTEEMKPNYPDGELPPCDTVSVTSPANLDGYVPRNNKLFSYPFCSAEYGDFTGRVQTMQFELSDDSAHIITVEVFAPVSSNMQLVLRPERYNGSQDVMMTIDASMKLPWTYDTFANWAGQNMMANALSVVGSLISGGMALASMGTGAGVVAGLLGSGAINSLMDTGTQIQQMSMQPNRAEGNINGDVRLGTNTMGFFTRCKVIRAEYARIWDDFFDMFGYEVDEIKVPNETGRPSWNYVRTRNCPYNGNVNPQDMALINQCYDAGVTFWRTWDVGNYSLNNR